MLNKILAVTTLILLIWLGNESLKIKKTNANLNNQLHDVQQQFVDFKDKSKKSQKFVKLQLAALKGSDEKTHDFLKQVLKQQKEILKKLKPSKKQQVSSKKYNKKSNSQKNKSQKGKSQKTANENKTPKKSKPKKKISKKELHSILAQHLKNIDKKIKSKKLSDALNKLTEVKKILWGKRNRKDLSKDKILSILSSVDLLQKKIKKDDGKGKKTYTTKPIKKKIAALKLKGRSKNGK